MKRVLIISYYWPPAGGSGVQRWVKFAKYLPSMGWQPVVYTPLNPEMLSRDESLLADIPQEAEIIRTPIREPYAFYHRLNHGKKEVNPLNSSKKSLIGRLAVWIRGNFFIPDPRVWWVSPSVKYLVRYLKEHPVDVIVTTGPPHSMHLIGLGLKKATGIRWIADFRDPWTEMFYFKHMGLWPIAKARHRSLEKKVLDGCDAVISVSPPVRDDFQTKTPTPVHLLTNGFDEDDFPAFSRREHSAKEFVLVHTGLFASDGDPSVLWKVLAAKCGVCPDFRKALRIKLAGKTDSQITGSILRYGLGDNLEDLGYLPHDSTTILQKEAGVLLLPLRKEPEYAKVLPGKIFEYVASGRPVLGIGQSDGAAAEVLRNSCAGKMIDWDDEAALSSFIEEEWSRFLSGESPERGTAAAKYSRRYLTEQLSEILEAV